MMFEQCKIVIFNNIIFMKKHRKIFRKNSMEIFRNFPEKYEIFRTNFPPHITTWRNRIGGLSMPRLANDERVLAPALIFEHALLVIVIYVVHFLYETDC